MKPAQVRMARAALKWSVKNLSEKTTVHRNTISNFENERYSGTAEVIDAIRNAFENEGVEFIPENGGGVGVRLRKT